MAGQDRRSTPGAAVRRRILLGLVATVLALAGIFAPAAAPAARAASDGLSVTTSATYTLAPARHVVRVVIVLTARNNKPNVTAAGIVTKYFYEGARIAIQAEATAIQASSNGVRLTTSTTPADGYRILEVRFRNALFYHQSAAVRITFDLPGGAPRSTSDIRVGTAFATFVAWAFGDGGQVRVVIPAGFEAETKGPHAEMTTSGGATIFRAINITDTASWYLAVNADRKSALTSDRIDLSGGEHVVVRAWPEDAEWKARVTELLTRGLPELVAETGLDWPVANDLAVFEVHTPLLEGYAGVFFVGEDRIEISEDLDDLTILHEASHAWFNQGLFEGRWINEGLADTYGSRALDRLGSGGFTPKAVSPTDKAAVRLSEWSHPGRITDDETDAREHYGYDAAWTVIRSLVLEVGDERMRAVLAAAQDHAIAYAGGAPRETVRGDNDWRRFLDLLDEVGGSTGADAAFRRWVVTEAQADQLDKREVARKAYADLVAAAGDWTAPFSIRSPLGDWDWNTATARMAEATAVLARRDGLDAQTRSLGLALPDDLRHAYEDATDSFGEANRIAAVEEASVRALATATTAVDAPRAPLVAIGLMGTTPEADLAAARSAFSAGRPEAEAQAAAVTALIDGAAEIGRGRLVTGFAVVVLVLIFLMIAAVLLVQYRRRRRARAIDPTGADGAAAAALMSEGSAVGPPPYATLADQSSGPLGDAPTTAAAAAPDVGDASGGIRQPPADRGDAP